MWRDILLFIPLAILTNTAFPLSFDPVLLYFSAGHSTQAAYLFALVGSFSASAAGVVDARLLGSINRIVSPKCLSFLPHWRGAYFYVWASLIAFSPLPYLIVRLALIRRRPNPFLYGLAVGAGRLPRYLLTVYLWERLALPVWVSAAILAGATLIALYKWKTSPQDECVGGE